MKKIYTKTVLEFNKKTKHYEVNQKESEFYYIADDAPIAEMKGAGKIISNTIGGAAKIGGIIPIAAANHAGQIGNGLVSTAKAGSLPGLAAAAGAITGGAGGAGNGTDGTQTQITDPWAPQQQYLKTGFSEAKDILDHPNSPMTYSPETLESQLGILNAARHPSALYGADTDMLQKTLHGDYLSGGAGFNAALDAAAHKIIPQVDSQFESRGRFGSGLAAEAKTSAIADKFAGLFESERQNQLRAGQIAPAVDEMRYLGPQQIGVVGKQNDLLNEQNRNARQKRLKDYWDIVSGNTGASATSSTGGGGDPGMSGWQRYLAGAGGGALQGYMYGGPWGAAAGGGLGLLGAYH